MMPLGAHNTCRALGVWMVHYFLYFCILIVPFIGFYIVECIIVEE